MNSTDKKLYELFSDKTLSKWCKVKIWDSEVNFIILWNPYKNNDDLWFWMEKEPISWESLYWTIYSGRQDIEILWHEPQLHDVFRVAKENWEDMFMWSESLLLSPDIRKIYVPYNPTLPLLQQSEETKTQLISLFS